MLVKVGGGGLCHSDLSLINGDRPRPVPIVLGHEGAGEIVEVGAGVHDVKKGDHVCFTFNVCCGRCRRCLEGRPYICERSVTPRAAGQLLSGHHRLHHRRQAGEPSVRRVVLRRIRRGRSRLGRGDRQDPAARRGGTVRLRRRDRRRRGDQHRADPARQHGGHRRPGRRRPERPAGRGAGGRRPHRRHRPLRRQARASRASSAPPTR